MNGFSRSMDESNQESCFRWYELMGTNKIDQDEGNEGALLYLSKFETFSLSNSPFSLIFSL